MLKMCVRIGYAYIILIIFFDNGRQSLNELNPTQSNRT